MWLQRDNIGHQGVSGGPKGILRVYQCTSGEFHEVLKSQGFSRESQGFWSFPGNLSGFRRCFMGFQVDSKFQRRFIGIRGVLGAPRSFQGISGYFMGFQDV